jgi:hypothetical protein
MAEEDDSFADDFALLESSSDISVLEKILTDHLVHVSDWAEKNRLTIAPEKSSVTLFTPDKHQSNIRPDVLYEGVPIPLNTCVKFLGLWWNKHFAWSPHADHIYKQINKQAKLLKTTSGQDWGVKEVLLKTYKTFSKPTLTYGAPVYYPSMGPDHASVKKLQRGQNNSMRIITGAHRNTPVDHLHAETRLLPIKDSLNLGCRQFLENDYQRGHPSNSVVRQSSGQRPGRKSGVVHTLQSRYKELIQPYLTDDAMLELNYKKLIKDMHTKTVEKGKRVLVNPILGGPL